MKPNPALRAFLALSGCALLAITAAHADILYWDGLTPGGEAGGGIGTWDNSTFNWSTAATGGSADIWSSSPADFAIFGGTAGAVTVGSGITTSGIQFNVHSYNIDASSNVLNFATGNNTISTNFTSLLGNITSINGKVAGAGANLLFTPVNPAVWPVGHIISFGGESSGGWDGSTTIDKNITVRIQDTNQALLNTSSVTLRGGMLLLTNASTQAGLDRVKDTAPIYSYGGNIRTNNTATDNTAYTETMGALNLEGGHTTLIHNLSNSGGTARSQLMSFSDITRASGSYATLYVGTGGSLGTVNRIRNASNTVTATDNNKIIGPWFTAGNNTFGSSDYARYDASGNILVMNRADANLSITLATTNDTNFTNAWTDTANYTTSQIITLSADREINTLRRTGGNNLYLNGRTLATNGILAAGTTNFAINSGNSGTPAGSGTLTAAGGGSNPNAYTLYLQSNVNLNLSAAIVNNGSNPVTLVLTTGSGRVDLNTANLHTGGTIISAHTARHVDGQDSNAPTRVELNIAGGLGPNTNLLRVSSGVLDLNGISTTVGKFEGSVSGTVAGNSGTVLTVGNGTLVSDSSDFAGTLDTISLTKVGAGTQILSGANVTTGAVTVSAGTLLVNGSLGNSAVTVNDGAFGGSGTIGSTLNLAGGSFHVVDLFDALRVSGTVTLYAGFGIDDLAGLTWGSVADGTYTLINGTLGAGVFAGLANNSPATAYDLGGGRSAYFTESSLNLVVQTIPEPRAALLGGLGLLALLRRRRTA